MNLEENTLIILTSDNGPVLDDGYQDGAVEKNRLAGHTPAGPYRDGKYSFNVLPALLGVKDARGRDHLLQQGNRDPNAFQADGWKLVLNKGKCKGPAKQLYNLTDDPGEQNNLAAKYPERVKSLEAKLAAVIAAGRSRP